MFTTSSCCLSVRHEASIKVWFSKNKKRKSQFALFGESSAYMSSVLVFILLWYWCTVYSKHFDVCFPQLSCFKCNCCICVFLWSPLCCKCRHSFLHPHCEHTSVKTNQIWFLWSSDVIYPAFVEHQLLLWEELSSGLKADMTDITGAAVFEAGAGAQ